MTDSTMAELGCVRGCLGVLSGVAGCFLIFAGLWRIHWTLAVGVALVTFANLICG